MPFTFQERAFRSTMIHPSESQSLTSSVKGEVKKKHISFGWNFSCFAAHFKPLVLRQPKFTRVKEPTLLCRQVTQSINPNKTLIQLSYLEPRAALGKIYYHYHRVAGWA